MGLSFPAPVNYDPIPAETHHAIITQLIDKGHQKTKEFGTDREVIKHQIHICYELPYERDDKDRPRQISQTYTLTMGSKANLRKVVHAAVGKSLSDDEVARIDPLSLLGKNVSLTVDHYKKNSGGIGAKVSSVTAMIRGIPHLQPEGKLLAYDIASGDPPADLPDWLIKTINESLERKGLPIPGQGGGDDGGDDSPEIPPIPPRPEPAKSFDEFDGSEEAPPVSPPPATGKRPSKSKKS